MRVGILGLGHVGLVNLCGFAKKGFLTIGFDLPDVVSSLKSKRIPFLNLVWKICLNLVFRRYRLQMI